MTGIDSVYRAEVRALEYFVAELHACRYLVAVDNESTIKGWRMWVQAGNARKDVDEWPAPDSNNCA